MKRGVLIIVFILGCAIGAAIFMPLETALRLSGLSRSGIGWQSAEGSLLGGTVTGLRSQGTEHGDVRLSLRPLALVGGRLAYDADWSGPRGTGTGRVSAALSGRVALQDFRLNLRFTAPPQIAGVLQEPEGTLALSGREIAFRGNSCAAADGLARSDFMAQNQGVFGQGWSPLEGALACEAGQLLIPLATTSNAGTRLDASLRVSPGAAGTAEARVSGIIPTDLTFILPAAGFVPDGTGYSYAFTAQTQPGTP